LWQMITPTYSVECFVKEQRESFCIMWKLIVLLNLLMLQEIRWYNR
jgi:hypothetical protein